MSIFNEAAPADGLPARAVGEGGQAIGDAAETGPSPELPPQATRRRFTAAYKLDILKQADACRDHGEIGALLRREGLYGGYLTKWRRQREAGALKALGKPRGRKGPDPLEAQLAAERKRAEKAEAELVKARKVIEVQGKVSALLEEMLDTGSANGFTPGEGHS